MQKYTCTCILSETVIQVMNVKKECDGLYRYEIQTLSAIFYCNKCYKYITCLPHPIMNACLKLCVFLFLDS